MSAKPIISLKSSLPQQHGWLLLSPLLDIACLLFLFPLLISPHTSKHGVEITLAAADSFLLEEFNDAAQLWIPGNSDSVILNGVKIPETKLRDELALLQQNNTTCLLLYVDHSIPQAKLTYYSQLAFTQGFKVGLVTDQREE